MPTDTRTIRYLRADLTCGECAQFIKKFSDFFGDTMCCSRKLSTLEMRHMKDPACMAFVPKE